MDQNHSSISKRVINQPQFKKEKKARLFYSLLTTQLIKKVVCLPSESLSQDVILEILTTPTPDSSAWPSSSRVLRLLLKKEALYIAETPQSTETE